jgi:hypothetical protein
MKEEDRLANRVIAYAKEAGKDIFAMTDKEWLKYRNVGKKCLMEIRELLAVMDKPKDPPLCVRDMFAMSALQGLLARSAYYAKDQELVNYSYKLADTMMEQRRKID